MTGSNFRVGKLAVITTLLMAVATNYAFASSQPPLTPELAAKQENYRKQKAQQHITQDQRKAAAEALKAERIKVHQARQAVKHKKPASAATDSK